MILHVQYYSKPNRASKLVEISRNFKLLSQECSSYQGSAVTKSTPEVRRLKTEQRSLIRYTEIIQVQSDLTCLHLRYPVPSPSAVGFMGTNLQ